MGVQFRQGPVDIDLYLHQQYAARPRDAPDFHDNYTKPYAGATLAILATLTQLQHAITQFVAYYPWPRWRQWSNLDRGHSPSHDATD